jgi:transcriptional regulator with XRE-family HTH domain
MERIYSNKSPKATIAGNNIATILKEKGMNQHDLADLTGLTSSHVSRIINNKRLCISLPVAFKIARALNHSVEDVFRAYPIN